MKTKEDICKDLSVSGATIANWVKTGLIPDYHSEEEGYSDSDYEDIVRRINDAGKLTQRANRFSSQQSRQELNTLQCVESKHLLKKLLQLFAEHNLGTSCTMLALSMRSLQQAGLLRVTWTNEQQPLPEIKTDNPQFSNFLYEWTAHCSAKSVYKLFCDLSNFELPKGEPDFLGAVYESMRNLGEKSKLGAFFTPSFLVNDLRLPAEAKILDPCSGTGTILLSIISPTHAPQNITLRDIDALSLRIAKVNFALFFKRTDLSVHTECLDALPWEHPEQFDYIITNPPWGAQRSPEQQMLILQRYPEWKNADSFVIILSQALRKLSNKGKLVFVLPESFLYVDAHSALRKELFETSSEIGISFHGNAFKGVQSKVIRLELDKNKAHQIQLIQKGVSIGLSKKLLQRNQYRPPAIEAAKELPLLEKLLAAPHFTLKGKCTFGLGIVTGNNKKHLLPNDSDGAEPIYTGKELTAFGFLPAINFIHFNPASLQQTAPTTLYRSPKICYRFISNKLIMAADFKGSLLLNSVNFFIPPAEFNIKALAAFFNAPLSTFLYQRLFGSVKVLRSHLESLPIPDTYFQYEGRLAEIYDLAAAGNAGYMKTLHELSCEMFGIAPFEL